MKALEWTAEPGRMQTGIVSIHASELHTLRAKLETARAQVAELTVALELCHTSILAEANWSLTAAIKRLQQINDVSARARKQATR